MIEKYLPRLLNAGPYFQIVLLMGDASARTLLGAFRTRLKALDIAGFGFKEYWFKTDTGIVLSISGSKLIIQLFTMFLAEFDGHYFQDSKRFTQVMALLSLRKPCVSRFKITRHQMAAELAFMEGHTPNGQSRTHFASTLGTGNASS
ncbi:hypothetical protein HXV84_21625 [Pseudomonas amygdali pv. morsprunorum]|nr:hypothetical protein [Pseudomonas amygdali pv. morsprunorum]